MEKFILFFEFDQGANSLKKEEEFDYLNAWLNWLEGILRTGVLSGGEKHLPLGDVAQLRKRLEGQKINITELLGNYIFIEVSSFWEAQKIAHSCPIYQFNGSVAIYAYGVKHSTASIFSEQAA